MCTERYGVEAERLEWKEGACTDKQKHLYQICNKYKKEHAAKHWDFLAGNYE